MVQEPPDKMTSNPNLEITQLFRMGQAFQDAELADVGLSSGLFYFVSELAQHECMTMSELSAAVKVDNAYSTRAIQRLVALGYVEKGPHIGDGRAYRVALTAEGQVVAQRVFASMERWVRVINAGVLAEDLDTATRVIDRWCANARHYLDDRSID
jgi:DNA-binding MarR family transcriptional regulator